MYGWLGEKTKELGVPYGFGYPAMLAMAGVRTLSPPKMIRPTMYVGSHRTDSLWQVASDAASAGCIRMGQYRYYSARHTRI